MDTAQGLKMVPLLDPAYWVAMSAPIEGIRADKPTLRFLDTENNDRITFRNIADAIDWLFQVFVDEDAVKTGSQELRIKSIDPDHPDGKKMLDAIEHGLQSFGSGSSAAVTLTGVREWQDRLSALPGGAGMILPEEAAESETKDLIHAAIAATGGRQHPKGQTGLTESLFEQFIHDLSEFSIWKKREDDFLGGGVKVLGPGMVDIVDRHRNTIQRVEHYFLLCRSMGLGVATNNLQEPDDTEDLTDALRHFPIAKPIENPQLGLLSCENPLFEDEYRRFFEEIVCKLTDEPYILTYAAWRSLRAKMEPAIGYLDIRPEHVETLQQIENSDRLLNEHPIAEVKALIQSSIQAATELSHLLLAEKAIAYQAFLLDIVNNFASFPALFDRNARAFFEVGHLVIDGRRFNLVVPVLDRNKHSEIAKSSGMFIMYLKIFHGQEFLFDELAVPVTAGGRGNLTMGKRGVFVHLDGRTRDVEIVHIIENPISILEAIFTPLRRAVKAVSSRIEMLRAETQKKLDTAVSAPKPPDSTFPGGLLVGGSVAVAAIGSALAFIVSTMAKLQWWQVLAGIGGALLAVIVPSVLAALSRLRKRDLSALIEASGWSVNARMRLTRKMSTFFTMKPTTPRGMRRAIRFKLTARD